MQPKSMCYAIACMMLLFASMAFAVTSVSNDTNGTAGLPPNGMNGTIGLPYANVTANLTIDNDTRSCALDVSYSSEMLNFDKHFNITGGTHNASISADGFQSIMMLRRSLDSGGGFFSCQLFTNGTSECYGRNSAGKIVRIPPISDIAKSMGIEFIGPFLAGPSMAGVDDTAALALLCPYSDEGIAARQNKSQGTGTTTNGKQGTGGTTIRGNSGPGGETIVQENTTGKGTVTVSGAIYANGTNGTAGQNATAASNKSAVDTTSAAASDAAAGLIMFATSHSAATAVVFVAVIAAIGYVVLKRGRPSSIIRR